MRPAPARLAAAEDASKGGSGLSSFQGQIANLGDWLNHPSLRHDEAMVVCGQSQTSDIGRLEAARPPLQPVLAQQQADCFTGSCTYCAPQ
jgi:hypothetical protein